MATVSENLLDLFGGGVTVAATLDEGTRRAELVAVTNNATIAEQAAPFRLVIGDLTLDVPFGYTEHRWERGKGPVVPTAKDRGTPRLEVHYG